MNTQLKIALLGRALRQFEVARRTGMSETRLSRIVQGRAEPTEAEKAALSRELGATPQDLFPEPKPGR